MPKRKAVAILTVALAIVLGSGVALADQLVLGGNYNSGISITGGYLGTGTASEGGGPIGPSSLNGMSLPWVYCVDIPDTVSVPGNYGSATVTNNGTIAGSSGNNSAGGLGNTYTSNGALATVTNAQQVAWLLYNFAAGATTSAEQVGLQAAIWNQIYGVSLTSANSYYTSDLAAVNNACPNGFCTNNYVGDFDWLSPNGANNPSVLQGLVTQVPDGGMTIMLLGGVLVGLGSLRLKFRA
jgi:hypothetical protein